MISFRERHSRNTKKLPAPVNKFNGWYVGDEFKLQLRRELVRSSRNGLPISQMFIQFSEHRECLELVDKSTYERFLSLLIKLINDNSRISDIKFLSDDRTKISILLLDTTPEGAKIFAEKLLTKLSAGIQSLPYPGFVQLIESMVISIHPHGVNGEKRRIRPLSMASGHREPAAGGNGADHEPAGVQEHSHPDSFVIEKNGSETETRQVSPVSRASDIAFLLSGGENVSRTVYRCLKRAVDVIGALLGVILFLPFFLIVPIIIKATSKGPVLFKQTRIGYGGKPFTFLKFRTMVTDSNDQIHREYVKSFIQGRDEAINNGSETKPVYKLTDDPRITRIGRFLRKTSLDELPQFFNVLAGSMSLVGPRPPIPYEIEFYQDWHLRRIMEAKPGITGLWQILGRNRTTFDDMVRLDLQYVRKRSIFFDLKIMLKTVTVFFNTKAGI